MNSLQLADWVERNWISAADPEVAAMLRKQDAAIQQLREALEVMVYEGHWSADEKAKAALAATEEFK
jgi:hypothetical protein